MVVEWRKGCGDGEGRIEISVHPDALSLPPKRRHDDVHGGCFATPRKSSAHAFSRSLSSSRCGGPCGRSTGQSNARRTSLTDVAATKRASN
ncbi:hypothetical protein MRX96_042494 [Rhipicephalus microplus]